ncbi:MAG: DUF1232 domain-containing protein [Spirochaetales bacterium]|nr:DUF1232 domain-containing protein [Spirochaetales bacterium]
MLFSLVNQINNSINQLNPEKEAPAFLNQVSINRPDFIEELQQAAPNPDVFKLTAVTIAKAVLFYIQQIPAMADTLVSVVKNPSVHPAIRCAVTGILVYLVQPHDLIPDNSPGGYGFLDDNAIIRAGIVEYLQVSSGSGRTFEDEIKHIQALTKLVPLHIVPLLQATINSMSMSIQLLQLLPPDMIEMTTQQLIQNPLAAPAIQQPQGFSAMPGPNIGDGHWSGGTYFEGNNVIMPGGPSLIDGELFIPY